MLLLLFGVVMVALTIGVIAIGTDDLSIGLVPVIVMAFYFSASVVTVAGEEISVFPKWLTAVIMVFVGMLFGLVLARGYMAGATGGGAD